MSNPWGIREGGYITLITFLAILVIGMVTTVTISYRRKEARLRCTPTVESSAPKDPPKENNELTDGNLDKQFSQYASFFSSQSN